MATEGGVPPTVDPPGAPDAPDADVVITTVVSSDDARPQGRPGEGVDLDAPPVQSGGDLDWEWSEEDDPVLPRPAAAAPPPPPPPPPPASEVPAQPPAPAPPGPGADLAAVERRLAALEGLPATLDNLGKAIRHELERCAGVLFGHDRALGALAARLDAVEAAGPAAPDDAVRASDEAIAGVVEQVRRFEERLVAMETRVEPLEPLPTVVQALRRAVRASDDLIAGETAAREQALAALAGQQATDAQTRDDALRRLVAQDLDRMSAISTAQAKGLTDLAERLAAAEARLTPLGTVPDDIAALSRILRRELDAIVTDNQARDQMLRRALQNEIDQFRAASEERAQLAQDLATRVESLETRAAELAAASDAALGAAGGRLEVLEIRMAGVDRLGTDLGSLADTVTKELDHLRSAGAAHDQVTGELTRRLSALDARLARLDPVPGEMQSLRTAMLQEAERTVSSVRATEDRIGQLAWVPGEFQEARKRIMALTSGVQAGQDRIRQLEATLVSLNERLEALRARVGAVTPPGPAG